MSLQTWKDEFYPVRAREVDAKDAVEHSLTKWRGLRQENLERHGVCIRYSGVVEVTGVCEAFSLSASTCALCVRFYNESKESKEDDDDKGLACEACPLAKARGGYACDRYTPEEEYAGDAPYFQLPNPEPMIRWLEKAKTHVE